jgi:hypothetical protein
MKADTQTNDYRLALRRTKRLLLDWVNLPAPVTDGWLDSMLEKHRDVFGPLAHNREELRKIIEMVRVFLQHAWKSRDMRSREWCLFIARQKYSRALVGMVPFSTRNVERLLASIGGEALRPFLDATELITITAPPETAFDHAVSYAKRMSYCEGPTCEEPFFLRGAKRELYCAHCKREADLARKIRYWNSKGKHNRKAKAKPTR